MLSLRRGYAEQHSGMGHCGSDAGAVGSAAWWITQGRVGLGWARRIKPVHRGCKCICPMKPYELPTLLLVIVFPSHVLPLQCPSCAGLGFGLPLSRLYARYFGGDLRLVNMPG